MQEHEESEVETDEAGEWPVPFASETVKQVRADVHDGAKAEFVDIILTFDGANSIIGKGFILHVDEDDLTSQPAGNAGARISCGVIELARWV